MSHRLRGGHLAHTEERVHVKPQKISYLQEPSFL